MGYEAMREQTLARQKELGIVPADTELPPINPIGTPDTRHGPDGQPFPALDDTRPWDSLNDRGEAAVRPDGRGLRRLPRARRPPHRPPARLPRGDRPAREHADRRRLRQRRERRGRPERLGQRDEVRQRRRRRPRGEPRQDRRARRPEDVQPLPERLGDGVQHAVQDVEALRVQRRHVRPVHHLVAGGHARRAARSATSTTTRSTSCRRSSTCSASRRPRRSRATPRASSTASACAHSFDDATAPSDRKTQFYSMLGSRVDLARGLEGRHDPPDDRRLGPLQRRRVGALPRRRRPLGAAQPRRRAAGQGSASWSTSGSPRPARTTAFPLDDRSAVEIIVDPAAAAHRAARPLRLLPGHAPRCPSGRPSTSAAARS